MTTCKTSRQEVRRGHASSICKRVCDPDELTDEAVELLHHAINCLQWSPETEAAALSKLRALAFEVEVK